MCKPKTAKVSPQNGWTLTRVPRKEKKEWKHEYGPIEGMEKVRVARIWANIKGEEESKAFHEVNH